MDENITTLTSFHVNENSCHCTCLHLIIRLKQPAEGSQFVMSIIVSVITIVTLVLGGVLNALILVAYRKNRELQTPFNVSLIILTVTDLFVCLTVQPVLAAKSIAEIYTKFHCHLWAANRIVGQTGLGLSLITITIMSVERFVSLAYPFRYQEIVTKTRLKAVFAIFLTIQCLGVFLQASFPGSKVKIALVGFGIFTALAMIVGSWSWIYRLTKRHRRQINCNTPSDITKKIKNTKTSYLMVGSTLLCYLPALISYVLYWILLQLKPSVLYFIYTHISPFCHVLMDSNSLLNPIILLYRKRELTQTVKQLLLK